MDCLELKPLARSQQHASGGGRRPRFCLAARPSSRSWRSAASASSTATPHHLLFYSLHMLSTALLIPLRLCPSRGASSSSSSIFVGLFLRRFDRLFVLFVRLFTSAADGQPYRRLPSAACRRGASDGPVFPFVCRVLTRSFRRTSVLLVCRASSRSSDDP